MREEMPAYLKQGLRQPTELEKAQELHDALRLQNERLRQPTPPASTEGDLRKLAERRAETICKFNGIDPKNSNIAALILEALTQLDAAKETRIEEFQKGTQDAILYRDKAREQLTTANAEIKTLREALVKVAMNLGNGSCVSPSASIPFMCEDLPKEVKLVCDELRAEIERLRGVLTRILNIIPWGPGEAESMQEIAQQALARDEKKGAV